MLEKNKHKKNRKKTNQVMPRKRVKMDIPKAGHNRRHGGNTEEDVSVFEDIVVVEPELYFKPPCPISIFRSILIRVRIYVSARKAQLRGVADQ